MEVRHWILFAVIGYFLFRLIKTKLTKPKTIAWTDVPEPLRTTFETSLYGFEVEQVMKSKTELEDKILIRGKYRGEPLEAEIECDSEGNLIEIEGKAPGMMALSERAECDLADLPPDVVTHVGGLLGEEGGQFKPRWTQSATLGDKSAYRINGKTNSWRWEIEMTESGKLIEFEKKKRTKKKR